MPLMTRNHKIPWETHHKWFHAETKRHTACVSDHSGCIKPSKGSFLRPRCKPCTCFGNLAGWDHGSPVVVGTLAFLLFTYRSDAKEKILEDLQVSSHFFFLNPSFKSTTPGFLSKLKCLRNWILLCKKARLTRLVVNQWKSISRALQKPVNILYPSGSGSQIHVFPQATVKGHTQSQKRRALIMSAVIYACVCAYEKCKCKHAHTYIIKSIQTIQCIYLYITKIIQIICFTIMFAWLCRTISVFLHVCMQAWHACMHACMHCMQVCICVCMCVYASVNVCICM